MSSSVGNQLCQALISTLAYSSIPNSALDNNGLKVYFNLGKNLIFWIAEATELAEITEKDQFQRLQR